MSLSDAICQELARAHHEKLIALKERSWLNPNLSHTAVRPELHRLADARVAGMLLELRDPEVG